MINDELLGEQFFSVKNHCFDSVDWFEYNIWYAYTIVHGE